MVSEYFRSKLAYAFVIGFFLSLSLAATLAYRSIYFASSGPILPNGKPLGGDFVCFYMAGKIVLQNPAQLYDWPAQLTLQHEILKDPQGTVGALLYAYPPFVALLFRPLASLPFHTAAYCWLGFSFLLGIASVALVVRYLQVSGINRLLLLLSPLAFTPFTVDCLAGGQTSVLGMAIIALSFALLQSRREFLAGLALGLGCYKPPLFLLYSVAMAALGRFRLLGGALVCSALLGVVCVVSLGADSLEQFFVHATKYVYGRELLPGITLPPDQGVGLLSALMNNLPGHHGWGWLVYGVVTLLLLANTISLGKRATVHHPQHSAQLLFFALVTSISIFLSVQCLKYDVAILLIPIIIVAAANLRSPHLPFGRALWALTFLLFIPVTNDTVPFLPIHLKIQTVLLLSWILVLQSALRAALTRTVPENFA